MKKNEKASLQILKITIVFLILIFTCNIAVRAFNSKLNSVKIILANNYEMNVLTTKTKISEILEENHIVVLPTQVVFPELESEISDDGKIIISKINEKNSELIELANEEEDVSSEQLLANYTAIVEKIEQQEEIIPFETITKNSKSISVEDRNNKVLQEGKDGLKKVTYKVKYQNDTEISRKAIKEEIIKKAVNKVVQVADKTTSRSGEQRQDKEKDKKEDKKEKTKKTENNKKKEKKGSTKIASKAASSSSLAKKVEGITPIKKTLNTSAYTANEGGSGKKFERTANGAIASVWYTVAAGRGLPFGTIIYIPYFKNKPNGGWFVVQDRGGAISNNHLDVYMSNEKECIRFGRRNLECYIYIRK